MQARIDEVAEVIGAADESLDQRIEVPVLEGPAGFARWASTYDRPGNRLVSVEQPAVWSLLDRLPRGRVLDAGCGTGRHTRRLLDLGHQVVGLDSSPEMVALARVDLPDVPFVYGDLSAVPLASSSFDLAVCGLVFEYVADIRPVLAELAVVVRPGGHVVISDVHPVQKLFGGAAYFEEPDGAAGVVRTYGHLHSAYVAAITDCNLEIGRCEEPAYRAEDLRGRGPVPNLIERARSAALVGLPAALIWELTVL